MEIYVVSEEIETGSESGETCWPLSAYRSKRNAERAVRELRREHNECPGKIEKDDYWCGECGHGFEFNPVALEN